MFLQFLFLFIILVKPVIPEQSVRQSGNEQLAKSPINHSFNTKRETLQSFKGLGC